MINIDIGGIKTTMSILLTDIGAIVLNIDDSAIGIRIPRIMMINLGITLFHFILVSMKASILLPNISTRTGKRNAHPAKNGDLVK